MSGNDSEVDLIRFIAQKITGKETKDLLDLSSIRWERFKNLIIYHELVPFAYLALKDFNQFIPGKIMNFLENNFYYALTRCQNLYQEFLRILKAFEESEVTLLPIKGMALFCDIYTAFPLRPMTDIDLLIREEKLQKAEAIFYNLGYRKELGGLKEEYWRKKQIHIAFHRKEKKNFFFVELHWAVDFKRRKHSLLAELWKRTREINIEGRRINLLSPEDTLFSLALHNRRYGKTFCLKNAFDAVLLLDKYTHYFDWDYCLSMCEKYKLKAVLFFLISQAEILSGNIPKKIKESLNISARRKMLIKNFVGENSFPMKNNFLREDSQYENKRLYLKSHFLLYDSLWQPVGYIINIPIEQFAKFYKFDPYSTKTKFLYHLRFFIFLLTAFSTFFRRKYPAVKNAVLKNSGKKEFFILRAWGWSMYPVLRDGDFVIFKKKPFKRGDIICIKDSHGRFVIHRLMKFSRNRVFTQGDNNLCRDKPYKLKEVMGVAVAVRRKNKILPLKRRFFVYFPFVIYSAFFLRKIVKEVVLFLQGFKFYTFLARIIFPHPDIEIEEVEALDFYFIEAKLNGKYAGHMKINKQGLSIKEIYVKVFYQGLGIEKRLNEKYEKMKQVRLSKKVS